MGSPTLHGRANYVFLLKPRKNDEGGEASFSITLAIPKKGSEVAVSKFKKAILDKAVEGFGKDAADLIKRNKLSIPLRDGDDLDDDQFKGHWVIGMRRKESFGAPGIVDASLNKIVDPTEVYSGMWVNASYSLYSYSVGGKKGVGCGLNNVQKVKDGERLGGGTRAEDDFQALDGAGTDDPEADDDTPF